MTDTVINCTSVLRVTATDTVACALPLAHGQRCHPDGTDNHEPASHQGVHNGTVYVWTTRDAGEMTTLRNAGFDPQCDHMARKLAVVVTS